MTERASQGKAEQASGKGFRRPFPIHIMDRSFAHAIRFLPVRKTDLPRINELSNIPEIAEHFESIPPVTMETTQAMWSYIEAGIVSLWAIHSGEQIIGGAGFYAQPPGTRLSHAATFFLYLDPQFHGRGIGTEAIRFIEGEARTHGYHRIECMVADTNPRALHLYKRLGYAKEGTKKEAFLLGDTYRDLHILGKILTGA